jgi:hypothetical protein
MYGTSVTVKELADVLKRIKPEIEDDSIDPDDAADGCNVPSIDATLGYDPETKGWAVQFGDNSYTGCAYSYPVWGVGTVYRRSNTREVARDLINQVAEQLWL